MKNSFNLRGFDKNTAYCVFWELQPQNMVVRGLSMRDGVPFLEAYPLRGGSGGNNMNESKNTFSLVSRCPRLVRLIDDAGKLAKLMNFRWLRKWPHARNPN